MSQILARVEQNLPLTQIQVIDAHAHIGLSVWNYIPYPTAEDVLATMDRLGIAKTCVSSFLALFYDHQAGNDEIMAAIDKYPDRIVGYAVVNPHYADDAWAEMERCFRHPGMKGIKIHPASYVHDYPINGPKYRPVWEFATRYGYPVLTHAGPATERHTCGPDLIAEVAREYPQVKLIVGHTGGYDAWDALDNHIDLILKYDNLWTDFSGTARFYGVVDYLVKRLGSDRIMFGSDATDLSMEAELGAVVYAHISDDDKEKILGRNAARLLGL